MKALLFKLLSARACNCADICAYTDALICTHIYLHMSKHFHLRFLGDWSYMQMCVKVRDKLRKIDPRGATHPPPFTRKKFH